MMHLRLNIDHGDDRLVWSTDNAGEVHYSDDSVPEETNTTCGCGRHWIISAATIPRVDVCYARCYSSRYSSRYSSSYGAEKVYGAVQLFYGPESREKALLALLKGMGESADAFEKWCIVELRFIEDKIYTRRIYTLDTPTAYGKRHTYTYRFALNAAGVREAWPGEDDFRERVSELERHYRYHPYSPEPHHRRKVIRGQTSNRDAPTITVNFYGSVNFIITADG